MNQHLKEAILKQQSRRSIKALLQTQVLSEEATLYSTFVEPFTDVLTAVNLGAQEILNSAYTLFRLLFTWDPEKAEEKLRKHDERKAKIAEKWKPLMDRTDDALSTGDADIIALTFAPGVYALSSLGGKSYEAAEGMGSFLSNVGFKVPLIGAIVPGYQEEIVSKEDKIGSLLDKLELLFLGTVAVGATHKAITKTESYSKNKNIILEGSDSSFIDDFNEYLNDTGVMAELTKSREELVESLEEAVKEFDDDFNARNKVFDNVVNANSLEEFQNALDGIDDIADIDASKLNSQRIKAELDKAAQELMSDEEFKTTAAEEAKKEVSEEELKKLASKVVFADAKKGLVEQMEQGIESLKKDIGTALEEILPSDKALATIKKSKEGIKFADFVEKTKRKYKIS